VPLRKITRSFDYNGRQSSVAGRPEKQILNHRGHPFDSPAAAGSLRAGYANTKD